jgi:putative FmdB family regulatory protein
MPIYEYKCPKCGVFEAMQRITEPALKKCPTCKSKVARQMSRGSFVLKGSGWYATDYAKKAAPSTDSAESSGASATNGTSSSDSSAKESANSKPASETKPSSESKPSKTSSDSKGASASKSSSEKSTSAKAAD